jgi:hypothetical protein
VAGYTTATPSTLPHLQAACTSEAQLLSPTNTIQPNYCVDSRADLLTARSQISSWDAGSSCALVGAGRCCTARALCAECRSGCRVRAATCSQLRAAARRVQLAQPGGMHACSWGTWRQQHAPSQCCTLPLRSVRACAPLAIGSAPPSLLRRCDDSRWLGSE